jgi:hypothetical protein
MYRKNGDGWTPKEELNSLDVSRLEEQGIEVELKLPGTGKILHMVPSLTGQPRLEMTFREAETIRLLVDVIPGAVLRGFNRKKDEES